MSTLASPAKFANPGPLGLFGFGLTLGDFGFATGKLGGWLGLLTGADAMLVAFIEVMNATANKVVIPLGDPIIQ